MASYPRLAAMSAVYLKKQLEDFASGARDNETMHQVAKALSPDERSAMAEYYAGLQSPIIPEPKPASQSVIDAGLSLANTPDWKKNLPACNQCHGPDGSGVGQFPRLAGQSSEYISAQLKAWKDGKRSNDPLHLMTGIASQLTDQQIADVSSYYASLKPGNAPRGNNP